MPSDNFVELDLASFGELQTIVKWSNLQVEITVNGETKRILDNIGGQTTNLELSAILGPSGAGKTTLLEILAGRRKHFDGSVKFYSKNKRVTFSYVPQQDQLADYLTVKESLCFASGYKNPSYTNHKKEADRVLGSLNLKAVKDFYTRKCSGGERKRLSIGLEMISKPTILVVDEPSSGLDSFQAYTVIEVLKNINKETVIVTTIHQPNSNLFKLFDRCFILTDGKCIYSGTPSNIIDHFAANFNITCAKFINPADFVVDVANSKGKTGPGQIQAMATYEQEKCRKEDEISGVLEDDSRILYQLPNGEKVELEQIEPSHHQFSFMTGVWLNAKKRFLCDLRDPQQVFFKLFTNLNFPMVLYLIQTPTLASETGCSFIPVNETNFVKYEDFFDRFDRQLLGIQEASFVFLNLMCGFFCAMMPGVLSLIKHNKLVRKECHNSYYRVDAFYWSLMTTNLVFNIVYTTLNSLSYFYWLVDTPSMNKFLLFWLVIFLSTCLGDLFGLMFSILYPDTVTAAAFGGFCCFMVWIFSGFFIPFNTMSFYIQKLSGLIFSKHLTDAMMRVMYRGASCRMEDHMVFSFKHLIDFIRYVNYENDSNLKELGEMSGKARNALSEMAWNRSTITDLLISMNDLDEKELNKFNEFWDHKTNYVLHSFSLNDPDLTENLSVVSITILGLAVLCLYLLRNAINK